MHDLKKYFVDEILAPGSTETVYLAEDVDEKIADLNKEIRDLKNQMVDQSWSGHVDRQGGSFDDREIIDDLRDDW